MKRRLKNNRGMTLIEVIIAMALLGIFTLMLLTVYSSVAATISGTRRRVVENYEIQAVLERSAAEDTADAYLASYTMTIDFTSGTGEVNMVVPGQTIEADAYSGDGRFTLFLPD